MFFKLIYSLFIFLINSNKLIMSEAGFNRYIYGYCCTWWEVDL